jgi:sugar (pentulose or hexulose) kinase
MATRLTDRQTQAAADIAIRELRLMDASPRTGTLDAIQASWTNVAPAGDYPQLNRDTTGPWDLRIEIGGVFNPHTVQEIAREVMEGLGIRLTNWEIKIYEEEAVEEAVALYLLFAP